MRAFKFPPRYLASMTLAALAALALPASAATLNTWDLTSGGTQINPGVGNHFNFDTAVDGVADLEVYAWSDWNASNPANRSALSQSTVYSDGTGLGACNPNDFTPLWIFQLPCTWSAGPRAVDNNDQRDWLLIYLPNETMNEWLSVELAAAGSLDMDVSYWIGSINSPAQLNGLAYTGLTGIGFGNRVNIAGNPANAPLTIDLTTAGGNIGNALLIGADFNGSGDGFMVSGVTALVPVPAAAWLFLSGLITLLGLARARSIH